MDWEVRGIQKLNLFEGLLLWIFHRARLLCPRDCSAEHTNQRFLILFSSFDRFNFCALSPLMLKLNQETAAYPQKSPTAFEAFLLFLLSCENKWRAI